MIKLLARINMISSYHTCIYAMPLFFFVSLGVYARLGLHIIIHDVIFGAQFDEKNN